MANLNSRHMTEHPAGYDIRCEWGGQGLASLHAEAEVVVIVDVLCFSTCVEIATTRGATVFPHPWNDETARRLALEVGAELARPRGAGGFSLSPASFLGVRRGARLVLPSPNEASLSLGLAGTPTLAAAFATPRPRPVWRVEPADGWP